jgi:hypothetical protein
MNPNCERCSSCSTTTSMSWFNTEMLCIDCKEKEKNHPLFNKAKEIENQKVMQGDYNFPGIFPNKKWEEIEKIKIYK